MSRFLQHAAVILTLAVVFIPTAAKSDEPLHPIAAEVAEQLANPDRPFTLIVNFVVHDADRFVAVMSDPVVQTAKEKGNVNYRLCQSFEKPAEFTLFEQWRDLAALDSHLKQPYLAKLVKDFEETLAAPPKLTVLKTIQAGAE